MCVSEIKEEAYAILSHCVDSFGQMDNERITMIQLKRSAPIYTLDNGSKFGQAHCI